MTYAELSALCAIANEAYVRLCDSGMFNAADALLPQLQELDEILCEMEDGYNG